MRTTLTIACWLIAITLLIVPACQREVSDHNNNPSGSGEKVTTTLTGRITDPDNLPVQGAVVKAGSANTTTDINGVFRLKDVRIDQNAGFIKVDKAGFFQGSRTIIVQEGTTNYVSIQLIQKTVSGTVSGNNSGTVTVSNGGTIAFTSGSFINPTDNTAYTGTVSVSAFFIDPADGNFNEIMPGTLRGINTANEETGLQSFGMMAVELNGAAGEKLQLATGKPATITFPIPAGLLAQAPATIPLWSFNDTTGLWKQEGTATRQGNNYVGTVTHFSFWNCDAPFPVIDFKAVIKDQAGNPLFPAMVELKTTNDKITSYGYGCTDNTGMISGKIPSGKTLRLSVTGRCAGVLHTQTIGPFTAKADAGTIIVNNSTLAQVTISGTAVNCAGKAVTNGFVDIQIDNLHNSAQITNGNFSISFTRCTNAPTTAAITAYDLDASQTGAETNVAVTTGAVAAGQLSACGNSLTQFVNYTLRGAQSSFIPPADSVQIYSAITSNDWYLWATRKNGSNEQVYIAFTASGTGSVPVNNINIQKGNTGYLKLTAFNMTITEFGPAGGYISGNLSTTLKDSSNTTAPVTLSFRVKRQ